MTKNILVVQSLKKSFGGLRALDDISFAIQEKEIVGVVGPNGSGKTTLLNAITGFIPSDAGKIILDSLEIQRLPSYEIARRGVGRTFQNTHLFKNMTVMENMMVGLLFGSQSGGMKEDMLETTSVEFLTKFGMQEFKERISDELSYGQQKLVELARIFARKPKLVLLDEPSQGINPFVQAEIQEHIKQQNGIGTTFIIVEHNMKFVGDLCSHVVVLNFGHKLSEGTPDEIRADQNVLESYLGRG